jgi:hypothetical protein
MPELPTDNCNEYGESNGSDETLELIGELRSQGYRIVNNHLKQVNQLYAARQCDIYCVLAFWCMCFLISAVNSLYFYHIGDEKELYNYGTFGIALGLSLAACPLLMAAGRRYMRKEAAHYSRFPLDPYLCSSIIVVFRGPVDLLTRDTFDEALDALLEERRDELAVLESVEELNHFIDSSLVELLRAWAHVFIEGVL